MSDRTPEQAEAEARAIGWTSQEEFKGAPEKWVDAETFLERGETVMPLLKATNKRLKTEIDAMAKRLADQENLSREQQQSLQELLKHHDETFTARVNAEKARLREEFKQAREDGDIEKELSTKEQLDTLTEEARIAEAEAKKRKDTPPPKQPTQDTPEFIAWKEANPWYGTDEKKTTQVLAVAQYVRNKNPTLTGEAFYAKLNEEISDIVPEPSRAASKVEGSRGGSQSGGQPGSYASLPAEAKQVAEKQAKMFVGEGKAFKTDKEWKDHYTKLYYQQEAA